jgi:hypothetical protein
MNHLEIKTYIQEVRKQCESLEKTMAGGQIDEKTARQNVVELEQQINKMKHILSITVKNPCYVLSIIDEGLLKRVVVRENCDPQWLDEFQAAIQEYLAENSVDGYTEDGYATIHRVCTDKEEVRLWSYPFDGVSSVEDALTSLKSRDL